MVTPPTVRTLRMAGKPLHCVNEVGSSNTRPGFFASSPLTPYGSLATQPDAQQDRRSTAASVTTQASFEGCVVQRLLSILRQSIRRAQARDPVKRNVALLCDLPKGQPGRPSKSLTREQAERCSERRATAPP